MMGETIENVSKDMDTYSYRQPIGVTAGVTPFNFPAMIPLWVCFPLPPPSSLTHHSLSLPPFSPSDVPNGNHNRKHICVKTIRG